MKKLKAILIIVTLFLSGMIYAQPPEGEGQQGPPPIPDSKEINKMADELATEITLTKAQKGGVIKLYTAHFKQVKGKTSGNAKPKREDMDAMKADLEKKVRTLLTEKQKKGYAEYLKKLESKRPSKK